MRFEMFASQEKMSKKTSTTENVDYRIPGNPGLAGRRVVPTPWHRVGGIQIIPKKKNREFCAQMFVVIAWFPDRYIWFA